MYVGMVRSTLECLFRELAGLEYLGGQASTRINLPFGILYGNGENFIGTRPIHPSNMDFLHVLDLFQYPHAIGLLGNSGQPLLHIYASTYLFASSTGDRQPRYMIMNACTANRRRVIRQEPHLRFPLG